MRNRRINDEFKEELWSLYGLYKATSQLNHIVEIQRGHWTLFEPSKFVYAYFAFNTYYSIDWNKSIEKEKLVDFSENDDGGESITEAKKYKMLVDFIFNNVKGENELYNLFNKKVLNNNEIKAEKIIKSLESIVPDRRISRTIVDSFMKDVKKIISDKDVKISKLKNIIFFISSVRNNIFHGSKTTVSMMDEEQGKRLKIYADIITFCNEALFMAIKEKTGIRYPDNFKIEGITQRLSK